MGNFSFPRMASGVFQAWKTKKTSTNDDVSVLLYGMWAPILQSARLLVHFCVQGEAEAIKSSFVAKWAMIILAMNQEDKSEDYEAKEMANDLRTTVCIDPPGLTPRW
jgi:hypothetical protein